MKAERKAIETLAKPFDVAGRPKRSVDMTSFTRDELNEFWETVNHLMETNEDFRRDWYVTSPDLLEEISKHVNMNDGDVRTLVLDFIKKEGYDAGDQNANSINSKFTTNDEDDWWGL